MATATLENETGLEIGLSDWDLSKHDCTVTLVSPKTGDHRTFRISTVQKGPLEGKRVVSLLTGQSNEDDFTGFGFVVTGSFMGEPTATIMVWRRFQGERGEKSMMERYADMLSRPDHFAAKGVEYLVSLRCRKCGRLLSVPESIADGLGPICRAKMEA